MQGILDIPVMILKKKVTIQLDLHKNSAHFYFAYQVIYDFESVYANSANSNVMYS